MRITPHNVEHGTFEGEVDSFLMDNGFLIESAPFHNTMSEEFVELLQYNFNPCSMYIRARADRVAIHPETGVVFQWEAKTHWEEKGSDMMLEALPLCYHLTLSQFDVSCLYVYKDPHRGYEKGFWIKDLASIQKDCIFIFNRDIYTTGILRNINTYFDHCFPGIRQVHTRGPGKGSGDPCLKIPEEVVKTLPHWKDLINDIIPALT